MRAANTCAAIHTNSSIVLGLIEARDCGQLSSCQQEVSAPLLERIFVALQQRENNNMFADLIQNVRQLVVAGWSR